MAQKLDANLNVIQETPIELELINGDLSIISKLDDEPNDVGGLTSTQLKAKFDEAGNIIKEYLNESLIPAVLAADATEATRSAAEAERVENELERVANENVRVPAETARIAAENIRIENEATRVENEEERIDAEAARKANEAQRIINENAREDLETGYVARAEAAAKRAEDAAADAENTVGGDYVTQEELDAAIGAIPTPDVYTKTETLADATKTGWGLGASAVPNDVFKAFVENRWTQQKLILETTYGTALTAEVMYTPAGANDTMYRVYYSTELTFDENETVSLKNPSYVDVSYNAYTNANVLKGKFWHKSTSTTVIYWTEAGAADVTRSGNQGGARVHIVAQQVTGKVVYGEKVVLTSADRNAYPDSGNANGFHYEYKGNLLDSIMNPLKIATGSYTGTGTYGASNPNSLTFDFEPKLVIITRGSTDDADGVYSAYSSTDNAMLLMKYTVIRWNDSSNVLGYDVNVKFDGKTVSWYTKQSNAECQANASSTSTACYHYFALG